MPTNEPKSRTLARQLGISERHARRLIATEGYRVDSTQATPAPPATDAEHLAAWEKRFNELCTAHDFCGRLCFTGWENPPAFIKREMRVMGESMDRIFYALHPEQIGK